MNSPSIFVRRLFLVLLVFAILSPCLAMKSGFVDEDAKPILIRDIFSDQNLVDFAEAISRREMPFNEESRLPDNFDAQGEYGLTLLCFAVRRGNLRAAKFLLENGADPNVNVQLGGPLVVFAAGQSPGMLELLLMHGGDPNSIYLVIGASALRMAVSSGKLESIDLLIRYGVDVNALDERGPALTSAVTHRRLDLFFYLVERGADPTVRTRSGLSLLQVMERFVVARPNIPIVEEWLVKNGYDLASFR